MPEDRGSARTPRSTVSAVLLAAGSSRRFAQGSKLLADAGGRPLIVWAAAGLAASRVADLIAVTGPNAEAIREALRPWPVTFVHNPDHLAGMGTSVAAGIGAVASGASGALVCPGDMPGVTSALVDKLIAAFEAAGSDRIVFPQTPDGRQGNPVLWPRHLFADLIKLDGPTGGKAILEQHADEAIAVPVLDTGAALDIDTVEDMERYKEKLREI